MKLIQHPEESGYPTEYLLARIKRRRAYFLDNWNEIVFHADPLEYLLSTRYREFIENHEIEGVWKTLLKEYQWIYFQMNKSVRDIFESFFAYGEIQTLIACLRYKKERGTGAKIESLLFHSILLNKIKNILIKSIDLPSALEAIERKFLPRQGRANHLVDILSQKGLAGVEQKLTTLFLEYTITVNLHPVIKDFFTNLIDSKNIISIYKYTRWSISAEPRLLNGGSIRNSVLKRLLQTREIDALTQLAEKITRKSIEELRPSNIERILYSAMTKRIKSAARENEAIELILDYLWRTYTEAQNLSVILHSRGIERDEVQEELIRV